jgi:hypothetical protein
MFQPNEKLQELIENSTDVDVLAEAFLELEEESAIKVEMEKLVSGSKDMADFQANFSAFWEKRAELKNSIGTKQSKLVSG